MSDIYTKLGDDGSTGLLFGGRVSKGDPLIDALGTLDEAVAALGLARASSTDPALSVIILEVQRGLFVAAADLAANPHARDHLVPGISTVTSSMVSRIEAIIDARVAEHPLQPVFVVPGANLASAALEMGRTIVRRAERRLVICQQAGQVSGPQVLQYLNRVSDLLYVLARWAVGGADEPISHSGSVNS
ncbi:MAG: cob(I)yrinic acid a,c-diamide adenosyltransferase [Thermaerobacter sp.]|nr:cob(I)yrinic acid a,c-diamide adenosyltransferase [Thermaerobacter sp.]